MSLHARAPSPASRRASIRISFTGELAYEINVPRLLRASHVWHALMQAGAKYGITPYGTEAMHVLRAEKGYIIVGQETDGTVTPQRSRHGLDRQQEEAGFPRQALAAALRHRARRTASTSSAC